MDIDEITAYVTGLGGVLTLLPHEGDGTPEIAWGDSFFYYAPDGVLPQGQPFATIVTKNYPEDTTSALDRPGAFRLNIAAGKDAFTAHTGHPPRDSGAAADTSAPDTVFAHPVYGTAGWLAVLNPGARTADTARELLRAAHTRAATRWHRTPTDQP